MRVLVILLLLAIVLMFWGGWLYFRDTGDTSEIIIDKKEVQQDTETALEEGREAAKQAGEGLQELGQEIDEALTDEQPATDDTEGQPANEGEKKVETGASAPVP